MATEKKDAGQSGHTRSKARSAHEKDSTRSEEKDHEKRSASTRSASNKTSKSKQPPASRLAAGKSGRTTDHEIIRRWIEERGGSPAAVKATEKGNDPGLLRINFPGYSGENRLEDISWDEFFKKFDEKNLEFLYQDETRDGEMSRFWKFVSREGEHEKGKEKE